MKNVLLAALSLLIVSCASVHNGKMAKEISNGAISESKTTEIGLTISGKIRNSMSTEYFGFIDLTFENTSDKWIDIKSIQVEFDNDTLNQKVKIISGRELYSWQKSMQEKNAIDEFNQKMIMGTIGAVAGTVALSSNDKNLSNLSGAVALGAISSLAISDFNREVSKLENAQIFPQNHLLNSDFLIPPGLFDKKWILLYTDHDCKSVVSNIILSYKTQDNKTGKVILPLRKLDGVEMNNHIWQNKTWNKNYRLK